MLNFSKNNIFAVVKDGNRTKKYISVDPNAPDEVTKNNFKTYEISDNDKTSKMQHAINNNLERQILYIAGPSGSGKSTYLNGFLKEYNKEYPHNKIILFSGKPEDDNIEEDLIERVDLTDIDKDEFDIKDFADMLVIFDDVDAIANKKIRDKIYAIRDMLLELGRSYRVYVIFTNHLLCNGRDTKRILNECNSITIFLQASSAMHTDYILNKHIGVSKKDIIKLRKNKTRWTTVFKNYPQMIMTEKSIYLLNQ